VLRSLNGAQIGEWIALALGLFGRDVLGINTLARHHEYPVLVAHLKRLAGEKDLRFVPS